MIRLLKSYSVLQSDSLEKMEQTTTSKELNLKTLFLLNKPPNNSISKHCSCSINLQRAQSQNIVLAQ